MKLRIIAVLLVLCLCASLLPTVYADNQPMEAVVDYSQFYQYCRSMYMTLEGKYDTVVPKDSNALSIGFVQWHGMHALQLLKNICAADSSLSRTLLGDALYNEVLTKQVVYSSETGWKDRVLTSDEAARVKALIGSGVGIQCQEAYAWDWIYAQAQNGWSVGIRDIAALLYYCGIDNQYGSGGAKSLIRKVREYLHFSETDTFDSLDTLHNGVLGYGTNYTASRNRVYNFIVNTLQLSPSGDNGPDPFDGSDPVTGFVDMAELTEVQYDAVIWAYTANPRILYGADDTHLNPYETLERGMAVTFLWRAKGCPEPKSSDNPFEDVKEGKYYYKAVLWAVENGITFGTTETTFSPKQLCTRADILTFLYRAVGSPAVTNRTVAYTDVKQDAYYYKAMLWALDNGIDTGTSATTFSPKAECPRIDIVTFLYRAMLGLGLLPH